MVDGPLASRSLPRQKMNGNGRLENAIKGGQIISGGGFPDNGAPEGLERAGRLSVEHATCPGDSFRCRIDLLAKEPRWHVLPECVQRRLGLPLRHRGEL